MTTAQYNYKGGAFSPMETEMNLKCEEFECNTNSNNIPDGVMCF